MPKTDVATWGLHLLEVEITTRCNLNCAHCYNRTQKTLDLPLAETIKLIELAREKKVQRFVVSGGEAVLHPEFKSLAEYLKTKKIETEIGLQSNGMIGQQDLELAKAFDLIHLSFEPDDSGVRKSSTFEMIKIAQRFMKAGIRVYFFATVYPGNIHKIDWMVNLANSAGVDIGFNLCIAVRHEELQLSARQRLMAIKKLHQLHLDGRILRFTSPFTAILKGQKTDHYVGIRGGCTAGVAACVILPNGDVAPCPFFRIKAGNIFESNLEQIWFDSAVFAVLRKRTLFDNPCGSCQYLSYCGGCRARAYDRTNKLNGHDPDCILWSY